jgi:hypothetical protein
VSHSRALVGKVYVAIEITASDSTVSAENKKYRFEVGRA